MRKLWLVEVLNPGNGETREYSRDRGISVIRQTLKVYSVDFRGLNINTFELCWTAG